MAVAVSNERRAVEIEWDTEVVKGKTVEIRSSTWIDHTPDEPETGKKSKADKDDCVIVDGQKRDVSTRKTENDGHATITYPFRYSGTSHITVTGSDGGVDSGTVTV